MMRVFSTKYKVEIWERFHRALTPFIPNFTTVGVQPLMWTVLKVFCSSKEVSWGSNTMGQANVFRLECPDYRGESNMYAMKQACLYKLSRLQ